ncbi:MAG: sigma-E factor negative regulatory protein [Gammaproteobacteria bacterium]|nr:sigma-E factor negative regulatory protein [Gammaproteobacteria bacterium]MDE2252131.1 sigma-E factor negative regulatory protein [Gammaproteobacteria bacterium]
MNQDELASQLSAMFDGELPAAECELLSRRLARDEQLRSTWSRYAVIGSALRAEPLAQVRPDFARRVSAALAGHATPVRARRMGMLRGAVLGSAMAAGVAGVAIMLLRNGLPVQDIQLAGAPAANATMLARTAPAPTVVAANGFGQRLGNPVANLSTSLPSYTVPPLTSDNNSALQGSLADYVFAHSEYSSPLARRSLLSNVVGNEQVQPLPPSALAPAMTADAGK